MAEEVLAEAERLAAEPGFPAAYLARVRAAAARLAVTEGVRDDVRSAALLLEQQAVIDVEAPVASRTLPQRLVKQVVRKVGRVVRALPRPPGRGPGSGHRPVSRSSWPSGSTGWRPAQTRRAGGDECRDRRPRGPGRRARSPTLDRRPPVPPGVRRRRCDRQPRAAHPRHAAGGGLRERDLRRRHPPADAQARPPLPRLPAPAAGPSGSEAACTCSTTCRPAAGWPPGWPSSPLPLAVDYHNITPAEYFDRWQPAAAAGGPGGPGRDAPAGVGHRLRPGRLQLQRPGADRRGLPRHGGRADPHRLRRVRRRPRHRHPHPAPPPGRGRRRPLALRRPGGGQQVPARHHRRLRRLPAAVRSRRPGCRSSAGGPLPLYARALERLADELGVARRRRLHRQA